MTLMRKIGMIKFNDASLKTFMYSLPDPGADTADDIGGG